MIRIADIELPDFPLLLAPMEDVSDPPFRMLCKEHGADLMYTEFISSEGLIRDAAKSRMKLDIFESMSPARKLLLFAAMLLFFTGIGSTVVGMIAMMIYHIPLSEAGSFFSNTDDPRIIESIFFIPSPR